MLSIVGLHAQRANITYENVTRRGKGKGNHPITPKLMQSPPKKKRPASAASAKTPSPAQLEPLDADMVRLDITPHLSIPKHGSEPIDNLRIRPSAVC